MPKIKPFNDFTGWLNANLTNAIGEKDLVIAKNVFYNPAGQLQTRRGFRKFGNQIGSSPIASYFYHKRSDTWAKIAICQSGDTLYAFDWTTRNAISWANHRMEFETLPWMTSKRVRQDHTVYKDVIYIADGVNPYSKYDGSNFSNIGVGIATVVTVDHTTNIFTKAAHWLSVNSELYFTATTTMPWGMTAYQVYYVASVPTANTFTISTTPTGATLDVSSNAVWTLYYYHVTESRVRYLQVTEWVCYSTGNDLYPSTTYYSDPLSGLSNLDNIDNNLAVIGAEDKGIINGLNEYAEGVIIPKNDRIYYASLASWEFVRNPVSVQWWWYCDRAINIVWNSLFYFSKRGVDWFVQRTWVSGASGIEWQPQSNKIKELLQDIIPLSYNSSASQYIQESNNYHFAFDSNWDDIPDVVVVYSSLTGWWTQYTLPPLYDFGEYEDSEWNKQYLFTSWVGWQIYEYDYWFDDNWYAIPVEIQTKNFDFWDQAQLKTFSFVDVIGRKQEGWEIELTVIVDGSPVWVWTVTDAHIDTNWVSQWIGVSPLGTEVLWWSDDVLDLFPFTVRIPFYTRWSTISLNIQAEWVQLIFEKMRVAVDAETIEVFSYDNIL